MKSSHSSCNVQKRNKLASIDIIRNSNQRPRRDMLVAEETLDCYFFPIGSEFLLLEVKKSKRWKVFSWEFGLFHYIYLFYRCVTSPPPPTICICHKDIYSDASYYIKIF